MITNDQGEPVTSIADQAWDAHDPSHQNSPSGTIWRSLSPPLFLLLLIAMLGPSLTLVTLPAALPLIADYFGGGLKGQAIAQTAQAFTFLGGTLGGLLAGTLIARSGLRGALILGGLTYSLGGLGGIVADTPWLLSAACFTVGMMGSVLSSGIAMATGAELVGERRSRMLGYQAATSDVLGITVGLAAGALAYSFGWRGPLAIYIAFGIIAATLALVARPRSASVGGDAERQGLQAVLRHAWPLYASVLLFALLFATTQLQLPFHLAEHGLATTSRAVVLTLSVVGAAVTSLLFGLIRARLTEHATTIIAGLLAAAGFAAFAVWTGGFWYAAAASTSLGAAIGICIPLQFNFALKLTPPHLHAYSVGILNMSIFLGSAVSPLFFAPIMAAGGAGAVFATAAGIAALGGFFIAIMILRRSTTRSR